MHQAGYFAGEAPGGGEAPLQAGLCQEPGRQHHHRRERLRPAGGRGLPVCPAQAGLLRLRPGAEGDGPAAAAPQAPDARHPAGPQADLLGGLCRQLGGQGHVSLLRVGQAPAGRDRRGGRGDPSDGHLRRGHPAAAPGHFGPSVSVPGHVHRPGADRGGRGDGVSVQRSHPAPGPPVGLCRGRPRLPAPE